MFGMLSDTESRQMAPFVSIDYATRAEFDLRIAEMNVDPSVMLFSVIASGHFVGAIMSHDGDGGREVFYWIRRIAWGRGLTAEAMSRLLNLDHTRPMHAHILASNPRARAVLEANGFTEISREPGADPEAAEVVLFIKY
jgi:RimJ/RimL family protein N-acetyltransferase